MVLHGATQPVTNGDTVPVLLRIHSTPTVNLTQRVRERGVFERLKLREASELRSHQVAEMMGKSR